MESVKETTPKNEKGAMEMRGDNNVLPEQPIEGGCQNKNEISKILNDLLKEVTAKTPQQAAGMRPKDEVSAKALPVITSEYVVKLARKKHWDIVRFHGNFHLYNGCYWVKLEPDVVREFLSAVAERIGINQFTARSYLFRASLEKQFWDSVYTNPPERAQNQTLINLLNGTLVVRTDDQYLKQFDKDDFIRYQLNFRYDPFAKAPVFQKYLDRVLPVKGKQEVLAEYIGYAFTNNKELKLEKTPILYGSGANGKSLFHDVISAMLGKENISHVTLQDLTASNGYYIPLLDGKLLNYASEISSKMDTTKFKTLVSGEPIQAREIFGRPYMMEDYARMLFNANSLPTDIEHNEAFSRRLLPIEFDVTIPEPERDPGLAGYIIENELPGVLNWALDGLERLLQNNQFTKCPEIEAALKTLTRESDSVRMFLDENFYIPSTTETVPLQTLYKEYSLFCQENGYVACRGKSFSARLIGHGFVKDRKRAGRVIFVSIDTKRRNSLSDISDTPGIKGKVMPLMSKVS